MGDGILCPVDVSVDLTGTDEGLALLETKSTYTELAITACMKSGFDLSHCGASFVK